MRNFRSPPSMSHLRLSRTCFREVRRIYRTSSRTSTTLRPYQEDCLTACFDALRQGYTRIGVSLPTGSGKTTVLLSLLSRMQPLIATSKATRSLIITNSQEITQQIVCRAMEVNPGWTVEVEQGDQHASGQADMYVTFVSYNC